MTLERVIPAPRRPLLRESHMLRLVERNLLVYRRVRLPIITGFLEPVFYLLALGFGVGGLVSRIHVSPGVAVSYIAFIGPGQLASAVMNDAVFDTTYTVFSRIRYARTYDALLATPVVIWDILVGEVLWVVIRTLAYACAFIGILAALGLLAWTPWVALLLPSALLGGFAFASAGMAAAAAMRSFDDWEFVQLAVVPLALFSTTLYPLSVYPDWLAGIVVCTPVYQEVALMRDFAFGTAQPSDIVHVVYLGIFGLVSLLLARRRLGKVLGH